MQPAVQPRYLLVNTGNANAGTGQAGMPLRAPVPRRCEAAGCEMRQVLPFSTGVIGEPLPVELIELRYRQRSAPWLSDGWAEAAEGI